MDLRFILSKKNENKNVHTHLSGEESTRNNLDRITWIELKNILNQIRLLMLSDFEESVIKSSENVRNKDYEITIASSFLLNFYFQLKLVGNPLVLRPD